MKKLSDNNSAQAFDLFVEGDSIRTTCRLAGMAKGTAIRLLVAPGNARAYLHSRTMRNVAADFA